MENKNLLNLLKWVLKKGPSETKKYQADSKKEQAWSEREPADSKKDQVKRTKLGMEGASLRNIFRYAAMIFAVLVMSIGQMWGTDNANIANKNTENKQNINTNCNQAGTYIYTPDLSTQDTIYLKHQDTTPAGSWWQRNGWNLIQAALLLVLGALMSLLTGQVSASIERKRRKQELIEGKAIEVEENIYKQFVALRNTQSDNERSKLLQQTESLLNEAELSMRTELYMASSNLLNFYTTYSQDDAESMAKEEALFAEYKKLYKKNNG